MTIDKSNNMWKTEDIQVYFSLLGASTDTLELVVKKKLTGSEMDKLTMKEIKAMGLHSDSVASLLLSKWKTVCSKSDPFTALDLIEKTIESYGKLFSFKEQRNRHVFSNTKQDDAIDTIKYSNLLDIIHKQEARIIELQKREHSFITELEKKNNLIKSLEARMLELETARDEKSMSSDIIKQHILESNVSFNKKISDTKLNITNIDHHVESILRVAKQTVDLIMEEERSREKRDTSLTSTMKSRLVNIYQIQIDNLKKESELINGMTLDPFVVFRLTNQSVETKKLMNAGVSPGWSDLDIELQAVDHEFDATQNRLRVEVWDEIASLSNELLCSGEISFTNLDLLSGRGKMITPLELYDKKGKFITSASVVVDVTSWSSSVNSSDLLLFSDERKASYEVNDHVVCNYGEEEGKWLQGRIIRFKKVRDRKNTVTLYDVQYDVTGEVEVNIPIERIKNLRKKTLTKTLSHTLSNENSSKSNDNSQQQHHQQQSDASDVGQIIQINNENLLLSISEIESCTQNTIKSVTELDEWQKKLTKLLSDALCRYIDINASAKKYTIFINQLTEKIGSIEMYLLKLEKSEKKCDELNANCIHLRTEIADLRQQLAAMTHQRDQEAKNHKHTKDSLENEKKLTLEYKKEIVELRSELDRVIEIVRRDMSDRITKKNVNEELYSLSSNLVNFAAKQSVSNASPKSTAPVTVNINIEHDDIFMQQHDWKLYISLIKENMTAQEVEECKNTLHNLNRSFEILSSRLLLECRHRADCEWRLTGAKDQLRQIKDDIITEATLRLQLEEEVQYFREISEKYKDEILKYKEEVEKHKKFAAIAKKAAYDAIKQARIYQKKLNIEIDNLSESEFGDSKLLSTNQDHVENNNSPSNSRKSTPNKKKLSQKKTNLDKFNDLFNDENDIEDDGNRSRKSATTSRPKSPYLTSHSKVRRQHANSNNLQTRSESEKDNNDNSSRGGASISNGSSKSKSKKFKIPGKKQMSYVGKKISRVLFDGKNGTGGVVPYDEGSDTGSGNGTSTSTAHKHWVNPNFVDYSKKYGKEPPTAESRRTYVSQQQI